MARDDHGGSPPSVGLAYAVEPAPAVQAWASAASTGPTRAQYAVAAALSVIFIALCVSGAGRGLTALHGALFGVFAAAVLWRSVATAIAGPPPQVAKPDRAALPPYSVIVPLYREAQMVSSLVATLARLDYPKDRLQILFVIETGDAETLAALKRVRTTAPLQIVIAPPGAPQTKPRACNIALAQASGEHVVVYDAEDRPHPLQLQEAAARFAGGGARLACLRAPLRIAATTGFLGRQFALEYAAQFEVVLPALAHFAAPFPLGGTSNHFRTDLLRAAGGWDPWNVTEDADLGFRLAAHGWRIAMLRLPTWESAPNRLADWLPQRTRWIKGYMQTWGVHMRAPFRGGFKQGLALQGTLGLAIISALAHGPILLILAAGALTAIFRGQAPAMPFADLALLTCGWGGAVLAMSVGAKRAGLRMRLSDAIAAPVYWGLQSIALALAAWQLCTRPYHWNKTPHTPPADVLIGARRPWDGATLDASLLNGRALDEDGEASVRRAA